MNVNTDQRQRAKALRKETRTAFWAGMRRGVNMALNPTTDRLWELAEQNKDWDPMAEAWLDMGLTFREVLDGFNAELDSEQSELVTTASQ